MTLVKWQLGHSLQQSEIDSLRYATRAEIEAALGVTEITDFDAAGGVQALISGTRNE